LEPGAVKDVVFQEVAGDASTLPENKSWRPINLQPAGDEKPKGSDASAAATGTSAAATPAPAGTTDLALPKPKPDGGGKPSPTDLRL
jgi:hypothetical protein